MVPYCSSVKNPRAWEDGGLQFPGGLQVLDASSALPVAVLPAKATVDAAPHLERDD